MINYNDNFIFSLLQKKTIDAFSKNSSFIFYDKRIKGAFRDLLTVPKPLKKYFFTENTMKRVAVMDLSKAHPTKLGYMFNKYGGEVGICFCEQENLALIYIIGINDIKILITSGTTKNAKLYTDENGKINYAPWLKVLVGSCIISYDTDAVDILPNNDIGIMLNNVDDIKHLDREKRLDILRFTKQIEILKSKGIKWVNAKEKDSPYVYNLHQDFDIKYKKIWTAIGMFMFLKTANVIDKTFVSDSEIHKQNSQSTQKDNDGVTVIDSTWDSSITVINPFGVSGHFRNQPKKNEKNEWYTELIYIDAFMKNGYSRKAGIDINNE